MGKAKDLATGASYVDTAGDTMSGNLTVSGLVSATGTSTANNTESDIGIYHSLKNLSSDVNTGVALAFGSNNNSGAIIYGQRTGANNEHKMGFQTRNSSGSAATRMSIDGSGIVTKPNNPSFHAGISAHDTRGSGHYNHSTGSSWVTVHNTGNHFSSGTFTAPVAGVYQFNVTLAAAYTNVHVQYWNVTFQVNGSGYIGQNWNGWPSGMSLYKSINNQCAISLQANDYVRVTSECNTSLQTFGHSSGQNSMFSGFLIG